jgi:hypothetical protein
MYSLFRKRKMRKQRGLCREPHATRTRELPTEINIILGDTKETVLLGDAK